MPNPNSNLPLENYTSDYIDSVKARFPEFSQITRQELIENLEVNKDRKPGEYEFLLKDALDSIGEEVLLNSSDESLFTYLFEELPQDESMRIQQGIMHVVTGSGAGDLVLGAWTGPKSQDRAATIGPATFVDHHNFIQTEKESYFTRGDMNKYVVTLSIKRTGATDAYGRKGFTLAPQLIQVPDKGAMIMDGMLFQKELTINEFKESFAKCITANN